MAKKMLIDATHAEETRVVVVDGTQVDEFDFETVNKRQLAGNIYLAKVTRVEPSLQAAFVDYGGNRHGFLAFAEIHPDYYQIPAEDRRALIEEERAAAAAAEAEDDARARRAESRGRGRSQPEGAGTRDARAAGEVPGMELGDAEADAAEADREAPDAAADETAGDAPAEARDTGGDREDAASAEGEEAADTDGRDAEAPLHRDERQVETASERDETIESVADEDPAEEIPQPRKPRARRYKIQEVVKVRQIMLVQVVKEERGNKGAALTTYLSLAGRYCVLMPNTGRGGGISRKITNAADRKKLKEIAAELEVPPGAGLIIRTAGSQRTRTEIRRDYEYLMRLWEQIRELTFRSVAPAPIYEEGDLIKRTIRDLYSKDIDEVLVEGERGYRTAKDFMKMIMPSHAKNVKHYADPVPLFARYQVEGFLERMFNPVVQLRSGGYIVIGQTEALVAIDVNSGRATKEGSIEETAYKTNCEAADEIARQLRLRDLAGLIVIDFIDMDERRNNANVEKRFKEALKTDRARIQVGRISGFGLLEMSRQRLHPGMLESTTQPCTHCHGTGLIRSSDSMALSILRAIEEEGTRRRSREVLVKAPVAVANFLINQKREHVALIEARTAMSVIIEADPAMVSPDWSMEKFKTATRVVAEPVRQALSVDASLMAAIDDEAEGFEEDEDTLAEAEDAEEGAAEDGGAEEAGEENGAEAAGANGEGGRGRRRRRRRRRGGRAGDEAGAEGETGLEAGAEDDGEAGAEAAEAEEGDEAAERAAPPADPRRGLSRTRSRGRGRRPDDAPRGGEDGLRMAESLDAPADDGVAEPLDWPTPPRAPEPELAADLPPADLPEAAAALPVEGDAPEAHDAPEAPVPSAGMSLPGFANPEAEPEPAPAEAESPPAWPPARPSAGEAAPSLERMPEAEPELEAEAEVPPAPAPAEPAASRPEPAPAAEEEAARPKRRGWWSFGA